MEMEWLVLMRTVRLSGGKTKWVVASEPFPTETKAKDHIVRVCEEFPDVQFTAVPVPQ